MGKKSHLVLPYALCVCVSMLVLGLVLWPEKTKGQEEESKVEAHHKILKREEDDAGSGYTPFPDVTTVSTPSLNATEAVETMATELGAATYIRWGRLTCPEQSKLVYHGTAGGGHAAHVGSPSNILCMALDPSWGQHNDANFPTKGTRSYMYGVEYKTQTDDFPFSHDNAETLLNHNLPCAVCVSKMRGSHLMVPGKRDCVSDWHLEYSGFLMAGDYQQTGASQFICVDKDPESDPAGFRTEASQILVTVEGQCGSLPCPPYINGREITCSVCTK